MTAESAKLREIKKHREVLAEKEAAQAGAFDCIGGALLLAFLFSSLLPGLPDGLAGALFLIGSIGIGVLAYRTRYNQVIGDRG